MRGAGCGCLFYLSEKRSAESWDCERGSVENVCSIGEKKKRKKKKEKKKRKKEKRSLYNDNHTLSFVKLLIPK